MIHGIVQHPPLWSWLTETAVALAAGVALAGGAVYWLVASWWEGRSHGQS